MRRFSFFSCAVGFLFIGVCTLNANEPLNELTSCCTIPPQQKNTTRNWDLFGHLLIWRASEETTSFVSNIITKKTPKSTVFEIKENRFDTDVGFRAGIGHTLEYDAWDTQLYWTHYSTDTTSHIPNTPSTITSEFFAGFMVDFVNGDQILSGRVKWDLQYNMFDWELGRRFCVSNAWSLRPMIGLKAGTINQTIRSRWKVAAGTPKTYFTAKENVKNHFSGIGPQLGLNAQWKFACFGIHSLKLFGDFSLATLWGRWRIKDTYKDPRPKEMSVHLKRIEFGSLTLRGFAGLGWDVELPNSCSRFTARLGYEMQLWLSHLRLPTFQQLILHGDLTLQGGTFECRFDF